MWILSATSGLPALLNQGNNTLTKSGLVLKARAITFLSSQRQHSLNQTNQNNQHPILGSKCGVIHAARQEPK